MLGASGYRDLKHMESFYQHVADILATIADRLLPETFAQLTEYGFRD